MALQASHMLRPTPGPSSCSLGEFFVGSQRQLACKPTRIGSAHKLWMCACKLCR